MRYYNLQAQCHEKQNQAIMIKKKRRQSLQACWHLSIPISTDSHLLWMCSCQEIIASVCVPYIKYDKKKKQLTIILQTGAFVLQIFSGILVL